MTFTQIIKDIFVRQKDKSLDNSSSGGTKKFLSKLSGAFMLPISVMAIAGLFLGVGAAFESHTAAKTFGLFLKNLGDPIFGAMPALFLVAVIISFTDDQGSAVFSGLVAFLVFNAIQQPFMKVENIGNNIGTAVFYGMDLGEDVAMKMYKIVGSNLGIQSLNTAVFGGIIIGFVVSYLYNKFHQIELPPVIAFFGGKRFVPLVSIIAMIPFALIFLLIWPFIGLGFAYFGQYSGKVAGLDSFVFGFVERSLIPLGLHHVFYAPLWYTSAGGDMSHALTAWETAGNTIVAIDGNTAKTSSDFVAAIITDKSYMGDSFGWLAVNGSGFKTITFANADGTQHTLKIFQFVDKELGINLGRFMQGKFSFMQLGLPAAGAAMVFAAPKENRKTALAAIVPAATTSFVTGVTEPIEFTFVFLAPALFWGFHATMAAISFMAMNLLGAHVGMTFSGGIIDTIVYGAIPFAQGTNFYWMYVIGLLFAPIYFFVFYWAIKKFNLDTPGRGQNVKLFTKSDYIQSKTKNISQGISPQAAAIVAASGGWENITKYSNCATRLRYDVKDASLVDESALKKAGAAGVAKVDANHVQIIMGPVAEQINNNIKANIGTPLQINIQIDPINETSHEKLNSPIDVLSVVNGKVKELSSLNDGVFSKNMLGDGVVISVPKTKKVVDFNSPVSGKLISVFPTGHAFGIRTDEGIEILIHIGIDTVKLDGKGFEVAVKQNDDIKAGDKLVTVDLDFVRNNAPSADTIIIVTSGQKISNKATGSVTSSSVLFQIN